MKTISLEWTSFKIISFKETKIILNEAFKALAPEGFLMIYGPFMRNGKLTSQGDIGFDKKIKENNINWGYKNDITLFRLRAHIYVKRKYQNWIYRVVNKE